MDTPNGETPKKSEVIMLVIVVFLLGCLVGGITVCVTLGIE